MSQTEEELKDLVRFLAAVWYETDSLRYKAMNLPDEEIKDFLVGKWPVIQGTRNQINLKNIGEQPYSQENIAKAVELLLKKELG